MPSFRTPGVKRAQRTEVALGALPGVMLIGLAVLIGHFHLQPAEGVTVLAQLADASLGHGFGFHLVQFATVVLLALAANTSFGGLPVLMHLLARDNHLPHVFALRADHQVHRHGVLFLALVSAALLVASGGDVNSLVPLFAIGVFVGFTICQVGMVRHRRQQRGPGWHGKALLNGFGALFTGIATLVVTVVHAAPDAEDRQAAEALRRDRELWRPGVPLVEITDGRRRLGRPIADHVNALIVERAHDRITVLIPEVEPARLWQRALQNQRGAVIDRALRRHTDTVVRRLRLRT